MNFAGGTVSLPQELLLSNMSGPTRIAPPEQPDASLSRITDAALFRLADNLATMLETEDPETMPEAVAEYIDLLSMQVTREMLRRSF